MPQEALAVFEPGIVPNPSGDTPEDAYELFIYDKAIIRLKQRISSWEEDIEKTKARRKERYVSVDVNDLRKSGDIAKDETFVPDRVIDTNIRREAPAFVAFLKQTRRLAIFNCRNNPEITTEDKAKLEEEFTAGLTYEGWINEFFRELDGAQVHGWDSIEVVYDESKPLFISFEHIGHENYLFDRETFDPQNDEFVLRRYNVTCARLEEFVEKFGFDFEQVNKILLALKQKRDTQITIYKKLCKYKGQVYVSWFCDKYGVSNWLKAPELLDMGLNQPLKIYPIFTLPYAENEEEKLSEVKGRGFLDSPRQEASTAIITAFVNGMLRASDTYAAPSQIDDSGSMRELDTLERGKIYPMPLTFFHQDYPDPGVLKALQYLEAKGTQESGQVDFAATNREDSRKTAKEISSAEKQEGLLKSVGLTIYSEHLRQIFGFTWTIVQYLAATNAIQFLVIAQPTMVFIAGQQIEGPAQLVNNRRIILQKYDVRPAGDTDVIERAETLQKMKIDWPVIATTPLAATFLSDYLRLNYIKDGERYAQILQAGDMKKQVIQALSGMIQALVTPEDVKALPPDQQQQLTNLQAQVQQVLAAP